MKKLVLIATALVAIYLFNSCASILSGSRQKIDVSSTPSGAKVYVNGKDQQRITPVTIKVPRKKSVEYTFQKQGYEDGNVTEKGSVNPAVIGNLLLGGIPGILVDLGTGAWYKYNDSYVSCVLKPEGVASTPNDPTIRAGEAKTMVSRDAPGATALERTIIRWYFDSAPRGARIFWRVISNVPDVVKNTNESYLTTTPYEETRSFNILGLTYENSRDVTIEIKLSMPGYYDQVKRYNVRQAIDQQEISGFFDLVKTQNQ